MSIKEKRIARLRVRIERIDLLLTRDNTDEHNKTLMDNLTKRKAELAFLLCK